MKALELVEFNQSVDDKETWQPPKAISSFLNKHFNRALSESECEATMKDFPKPQSGALAVPKIRQPGKGSPQGRPTLWCGEVALQNPGAPPGRGRPPFLLVGQSDKQGG